MSYELSCQMIFHPLDNGSGSAGSGSAGSDLTGASDSDGQSECRSRSRDVMLISNKKDSM
jgi:hypothetical protein